LWTVAWHHLFHAFDNPLARAFDRVLVSSRSACHRRGFRARLLVWPPDTLQTTPPACPAVRQANPCCGRGAVPALAGRRANRKGIVSRLIMVAWVLGATLLAATGTRRAPARRARIP
jgi:hypothetical protein